MWQDTAVQRWPVADLNRFPSDHTRLSAKVPRIPVGTSTHIKIDSSVQNPPFVSSIISVSSVLINRATRKLTTLLVQEVSSASFHSSLTSTGRAIAADTSSSI